MVANMPNVTCECLAFYIEYLKHFTQTFLQLTSCMSLTMSQHPVSLMADKTATRMPSFTLQPHHLAISHGIARMQGPLSDTDNSSFFFFFFGCVCGGGGGQGG